jgi:hypothetical protein
MTTDCGVQDLDVVVSAVSEEPGDGGCRFFLNICDNVRGKQCRNTEDQNLSYKLQIANPWYSISLHLWELHLCSCLCLQKESPL